MRFTLNSNEYDIDPDEARARLRGHPPEPLQIHWVELDGSRWPPKQAFEVVSGIQRAEYTTHRASDLLHRLGLTTSRHSQVLPPTKAKSSPPARPTPSRETLRDAVDHLADFMAGLPLTSRVATLETALVDADGASAGAIADDSDVVIETLTAALAVRDSFGRVSDVIHALVITLALPRILQPGEVITVRPSLAAGNDPSRKFDLETNMRVAEFKVSGWTGADAMRKRGAFVDLVHVALDESPRAKYVYVLGDASRRFLENTTSTAAWGFTRKSDLQRAAFEKRWGPPESITIADFRRTHASDVQIVDLYDVLPELRAASLVDELPQGADRE